ncbi:MAG TPA: TetR/AcrR family transcriptional regulator [Rhizomicrobium sp.]|jgi:AcrR family transcriptional regulator|nr:TetR/AcrR family transcriptional regulator [Rhizomicrobium sp.]
MTVRSVVLNDQPRWTRRKEERGPEILDAALACFSEKGFAATRMEDIARRAGISKGTIYLYFESKEAVFKALARAHVAGRVDEIRGHIEAFEGSTSDLLQLVLYQVGSLITGSNIVVLPRMVLAEAGNFPELAEHWRREVVDKGVALWESIIRRGQTRGEFRAVDPSHAARLCIAPLILAALWRSFFSRFDATPYDYEGLIAAHIDVLLRGLAAEQTL